ncbi:MAG: hypothetical protein IPH20_21805 [Bacteroidales bacterium]|nr:hypothetical protein [Bacteroidales bacterium]
MLYSVHLKVIIYRIGVGVACIKCKGNGPCIAFSDEIHLKPGNGGIGNVVSLETGVIKKSIREGLVISGG